MKLIIILLLLSFNANAEDRLVLNIGSHHFEDNNFNEQNYGIGFKHGSIEAGYYKNSEFNDSYYFGFSIEKFVRKYIRVGVDFGCVSGYSTSSIVPYAMPNLQIGETQRLKIGILPIDGGVITFQMSMTLR